MRVDAGDATVQTAPTPEAARVSIRVFGGVGVDGPDGPLSVGGPRQRRLLALLAARPGTVLTRDWVAEYLWDDADRPDDPTSAIRTYFSRLRHALPGEAHDWVETVPSGYQFTAPSEAVEHLRFSGLRAAADRARANEDPQRALDLLDEALDLWRGDPFLELEDVDWVWAEVEQLRLDRLEMQEERWEAALALGRHTQITGELAAFTAENGERDRAVRQHALALHRSGRTPDALRVIADHRRLLAEQSGMDPSPAMVELEQALFAGDSSLDIEKVGRPLRGYRLLEEAGVGAFSVVWRGIQPSVEREVAVKQIRADLATQPEFIRRFEAEAHLVARLEHPHIVPLIDYWRDPDSAYLVMRWLRGGTLERRLDDGPLSPEEVLTLAQQIGGALSTAHAHGVIHRDVKTANILFDERGHAFLGDFGIALQAAESAGPEAKLSPGSPLYAAPEQLRGEPLGPAADVFSLGVVLYECLRGSLPFPASSSAEHALDRQLNEAYPMLHESGVEVPASLSAVIARATAKSPADRFASIDEFVEALAATSRTPSVAGAPPAAPSIGDAASPYVGLRAFDDADADRFFGRGRLVSQIVERLDGTDVGCRCVVVVGPSGSGKSSVARAGVLPALRAGAVAGSEDWFFTSMRPGGDPYETLESALLRVAVNPPESLVGQLREGPRGILRGIRRCLGDEGQRMLLLVDQFEEIFTAGDPDVADAFLEGLAVAVQDPLTPLRLIATLRADYYDRPLEHASFAAVLTETAVDVTPLAADEMERAIVEPARVVGASFEPGLVARLSAEAVGQPSPLPLLQYTLSELFDRRQPGSTTLTIADYEAIGGLSGALGARAESIYLGGNAEQQAAARRAFGRLVSPVATSADLRRRSRRADLGQDDGVEWVLAEYGSARLLTFDREEASREPTVEVAHEALLREWPRLVGWLDEDRELLRSTDAIASAADTWAEGGRQEADLYRGGRLDGATGVALASPDRLRPLDIEFVEAARAASNAELETERTRVRRLRRLVAGVAAALVVALVAGAIALREQSRADDEAVAAMNAADESARQADVAQRATEDAEFATLISRSAADSADDPESSILLALEAHRRRQGPQSERALLNALASAAVALPLVNQEPFFDEKCPFSVIDSAGQQEFGILGGRLMQRDVLTGDVTEHALSPRQCLAWFADTKVDRQLLSWVDGLRMELGPVGEPPDAVVTFDEFTTFAYNTFLPTGMLAIMTYPEDGLPVFGLLDWRTGELVGEQSTGGEITVTTTATGDGETLATSFATPGGPDGEGTLLIIDGRTGEVLHRLESETVASALDFDDASDELLVGTNDGRLLTVDVTSGEVVSDVVVAATSGITRVGVLDDGHVAVLSAGLAEIVDRRTGVVGEPLQLRDVEGGRVRDDGLVVAFDADGGTDVVGLDGNQLVGSSHDIPPFGWVSIREGIAAVAGVDGSVETIDLATGTSGAAAIGPRGTHFESNATTNEPLLASRWRGAGYPAGGGVWTTGIDGVVRYWEAGEVLHSLDLRAAAFNAEVYGDQIVVLTSDDQDTVTTHLLGLSPDGPQEILAVETPDAVAAVPAPAGGLYVVDVEGRLDVYGSDSELVEQHVPDSANGELWNPETMVLDEATGRVGIASGFNGVFLVDPETGASDLLAEGEKIVNMGFARAGRLLVTTSKDGTVKLWDLESGELAGVVWDGTGAVAGSPSWYDAETDTVWVSTSGKLLQIPLDPDVWVERACTAVGRELTPEEWGRLVPGDEPQRPACT